MEHYPPGFIVTGKRRGGKTSFLGELVERFRTMNFAVDGILAIASSADESPESYTMYNIGTGESIPLCSRMTSDNWIRVGNFYFNPMALEAGNKILTDPAVVKNDLIIIDEIGKFELDGKIWATSLSWLLRNASCPLVLSVRVTFTDQVINKWNLQIDEIFDIATATPYLASEAIINRIKTN
jgi:nucleoside-triphosphatase